MSQGWSDWLARLRWWWKIMFLDMRRHWGCLAVQTTQGPPVEKKRKGKRKTEGKWQRKRKSIPWRRTSKRFWNVVGRGPCLVAMMAFRRVVFALWCPRHFFPLHHEVRREHPQAIVHQCRVFRWHDQIPSDWCMTKKWRRGYTHNEDQRCFLRQTESTQYRLEDRFCLPSGGCGSWRASTMDLARPSPTGRASELNICISEQQFCMEIDSISIITEFSRDVFQCLSSAILNCLYIYIYILFRSLWYCCNVVISLFHRVQKKKAQARIIPRRKARVGSKKEKGKEEAHLQSGLSASETFEEEWTSHAWESDAWSSSQCLDDSWTQVAGWKSARVHTA